MIGDERPLRKTAKSSCAVSRQGLDSPALEAAATGSALCSLRELSCAGSGGGADANPS
jgi:hypothetical protein